MMFNFNEKKFAKKLAKIIESPRFSLWCLRFGELTPLAAKLLCRELGYKELDTAVDPRIKNNNKFWIAVPPGEVTPVPITPMWEKFYQEKGKRWIEQNLAPIKTAHPYLKTAHPYYILHLDDCIHSFLDTFVAILLFCSILLTLSSIIKQSVIKQSVLPPSDVLWVIILTIVLIVTLRWVKKAWIERFDYIRKFRLFIKTNFLFLFGIGVIVDILAILLAVLVHYLVISISRS